MAISLPCAMVQITTIGANFNRGWNYKNELKFTTKDKIATMCRNYQIKSKLQQLIWITSMANLRNWKHKTNLYKIHLSVKIQR